MRKRAIERAENKSRRENQKNTSCPVLSIQSKRYDNMDTKYFNNCKPWKQTAEICDIAYNFYCVNKDIYCSRKPKNTRKIICSVGSSDKIPEINCNKHVCKSGSIFVGSVNPKTGVVMSQDWTEFRSVESLELALPGMILNNVKNGLSFCLIRCVKNDDIIDQLLTFPRIFKQHRIKMREQREMYVRGERKRGRKQRGKRKKLFNINILVLDSVSRNHFYRMLNETVSTLREAVSGRDVRVLDYEFLQSLAPYTSKNIKALFTGTTESEAHHNLKQNIGINTLYAHFKRHGYYTLFQEDSCWYDRWGTVLENNIRKEKIPVDIEELRKSWRQFRNLTKTYSIDDYGLTHFSCVTFAMNRITNMFNKPLKVCYDGQPISSYFLRYAQDFLKQANSKDRPAFSYLHSNFGHEESGLRIKALDNALSEFVGDMAKRKDTLTIILSDHGPKTTIYSQDYLHGRYETYDSLLFMIIPKKVQNGLGESRISTLAKNQKSLITMHDIHQMLTEMTQLHRRKRSSGLFSDVLKHTCDSIPLINYGLCKCRDWERLFTDQSPRSMGLAEFATKFLNNKIREQFSISNRSGFGKCRDLQLHRIWNIRQRISNDTYITTFDLVVQPFYTVFLVQTKHTESNGIIENIQLQSWRRVSLYRHYIKCKDKSVDIELCVCNRKKRNFRKRLLRMIEDAKVSKNSEIINTKVSCLYILLTKVKDKLESIFSYDAINICSVGYMITAVYNPKNADSLQDKKIRKEMQPNTDTFLFTVVVKEKRKPMFKYHIKRT